MAPYTHAVGVSMGSMFGFSYKRMDGHFAFTLDLGTKFTIGSGVAYNFLPSWYYLDYENYVYFDGVRPLRGMVSTVELNINFLRQDRFATGLYGIIGGGPTIGYCWSQWNGPLDNFYVSTYGYDYPDYYWYFDNSFNTGKAGLGLLLGLEYKFDIPLSLQADFRPACGLLFARNFVAPYFDWGLNLAIRYTID